MAASFYSSPLIGATTTLACFAHEIPHEIADYSILVRSGFTKRQAMQSQFLTAVGAFVSVPLALSSLPPSLVFRPCGPFLFLSLSVPFYLGCRALGIGANAKFSCPFSSLASPCRLSHHHYRLIHTWRSVLALSAPRLASPRPPLCHLPSAPAPQNAA